MCPAAQVLPQSRVQSSAKPLGAIVGFLSWILGKVTRTREYEAAPLEVSTSFESDMAVATLDEPDEEFADTLPPAETKTWWAPPGATQTELQPPPRPDLCPEARALEANLMSHFDGHDLELPPLPIVPQRVLERLRHEDFSFDQVAADIAQDQVIAAAVLRMVNSPIYRGIDKITQLPAAVKRLGRNAVRALMMHESLHAATFLSKGTNVELANRLWTRARASGWIMRSLAPLVSLQPEDAFLIGLLHDIGGVMVLRLAGGKSIPGYKVDADTFEYLCHECHQEFGELIAAGWKLPERLASLIADHHRYPAPDDPARTERLCLQTTDMIAALLEYSPPVRYDLIHARPVIDLGLSDSPRFVPFLVELPELLADCLDNA